MIVTPESRPGFIPAAAHSSRSERKVLRSLPEGTKHVGVVGIETWVNDPVDVGEPRLTAAPDGWPRGVLDVSTSIGQTPDGDYVTLTDPYKRVQAAPESSLPAGTRFVISPEEFDRVTSDAAYRRLEISFELAQLQLRTESRTLTRFEMFLILSIVGLFGFVFALAGIVS